MGWDSVLKFGVPLAQGLLGHSSANAQQSGAQAGLDFTKSVYGDAQNNFAPYLGAGTTGLNGLNALAGGNYSGFFNSPDYKAAEQAMVSGADHSAAAGLRLNSGGYQKDLAAAEGNLASQYLGNYRNSLQYLANLGQNSASNLANFGNNNAQLQNGQYGNIADAKSSNYYNTSGTLGNLAGLLQPSGGGQSSSYGGAAVAPPTLYQPPKPTYPPYTWGG